MLQQHAKNMEDELCRWKDTVRCRREQFYELNYFNTLQLLNLRKELGKLKISEGSFKVSHEVLALLQSISSRVTPQIVSDTVCKERTKSVAEHMGDPEQVEDAKMEEKLTTLTDTVTSPHTSEEAELPPSMSDIVRPKLKESELDEIKKEIMANIMNRLNYSDQLVLKAFEECPKGSDRFDYERWCIEHENMDALLEIGSDVSSESSGDTTSSDSDDDSGADKLQLKHSAGMCTIVLFICAL